VHLCDKTECVFSINLSHVQQLIEEQLGYESAIFIRIGKQLIVNRSYIFKINPAKQQLIMLNNEQKQAFVLQASKEALKKLKDLIEKERG
jgi:DNA-binding LytR/AlgR family response regulator